MSGASWAIWLGTAAAGFGVSAYLYRYRESRGQGRPVLVGLRGTTLALLSLLIFDPSVSGPALDGRDRLVLLDASSSMGVEVAGTSSAWEEGLEKVRSSSTSDVLLVGDAPRLVPASALDSLVPADPRSRLLPALQAAAQTGARSVTLITDARLDDAIEVSRWLPRLGLALDVEIVGGETDNASIVRAWGPAWVEAGQPADISFELMAVGGGPDSLVVRVLDGDAEVGRTVVPRPGPGRLTSGSLRVATGSEPGPVRFDVALEPGDGVLEDDTRHVYMEVSALPAGIAVVSLRPDWETRFLYPVLDRAMGLPVRSYMRTGGRWVEQGTSSRAGLAASEREVFEAVKRAELVVLHGVEPAVPEPVVDSAVAADRLLLFPAGTGSIPPIPIPLPPPVTGDWYVSAQLPPSPIAAALAGVEVADVPPLTALRIPDPLPGTWAAANVNRGRRGAAYPLALAGSDGRRRWVVALGEGYWTWAFRGGDSKATYERLWSALGRWLLEGSVAVSGESAAPASRIIEAGRPVLWSAPDPDSFRIQIAGWDGAPVIDTVVRVGPSDTASTGVVRPGRYRYTAANIEDPTAAFTGEFTVEAPSTENIRVSAVTALSAPFAELRETDERLNDRPLHASPWPYILIVGLLCAEWVLRRRWGLR